MSKKTNASYKPLAIFDTIETLEDLEAIQHIPKRYHQDYQILSQFLLSYQHNSQTFKSFRREAERLAQWSWFVAKESILNIDRQNIEEYLRFCRKPPISWVGIKNVSRFVEINHARKPNPEWKPFVSTVSKSSRQKGIIPIPTKYQLSDKGFQEILTVLKCLYNYLIQEGLTEINPIQQIRQRNRFTRKQQGLPKIRRISELQWSYVIETAELMGKQDGKHERTLFIISILYGMYLRISELVASDRWQPRMNDFNKDYEGNWWFTTVGKGNKQRIIAVSNAMLVALKRWRKHLKLFPALPTPNDNSPLIPKHNRLGAITDSRYIRRIVQTCFDKTVNRLHEDGFKDDAEALAQATVHWLRHTGISDDVKIRPREHVRDDAGHSSGAITDKYIDINLHERHASAKKKLIKTAL